MSDDYYSVLGVDRDATPEEVKRAYRQMARKYHPDVSTEPDAEEKFKEVNAAYEVLSDPEKRAMYDRFGKEGMSGFGGFDFGDMRDPFDIFAEVFGNLGGFGVRAPPDARAQGGQTTSVQASRSPSKRRLSHREEVESGARSSARCVTAVAEPGTSAKPARTVAAMGTVRQSSTHSWDPSSTSRPANGAAARAKSSRTPFTVSWFGACRCHPSHPGRDSGRRRGWHHDPGLRPGRAG